MKRVVTSAIVAALLAMAGSASALTINNGATDVGNVDTLIASTQLDKSSLQSELDWINSTLKTSFTTDAQYTSLNWTVTDQNANVWSTPVAGGPGYYLIKTGKGVTESGDYDFLFQNLASTNFAVIDLYSASNGLYLDPKVTVTGISHLTTTDTTAPVPEPGTMMMLGAGFLGLAVYGKRRRNA